MLWGYGGYRKEGSREASGVGAESGVRSRLSGAALAVPQWAGREAAGGRILSSLRDTQRIWIGHRAVDRFAGELL